MTKLAFFKVGKVFEEADSLKLVEYKSLQILYKVFLSRWYEILLTFFETFTLYFCIYSKQPVSFGDKYPYIVDIYAK